MLAHALKEKEKCMSAIKRLEAEIQLLYEHIRAAQVEKRLNELWLQDAEKIISETTSAAPHD